MWSRKKKHHQGAYYDEGLNARFKAVYDTFEGMTKRLELLEKGREVSAKLKGSGIQDCMKLLTTVRADLVAHDARLKTALRWDVEQDERIADLEERVTRLTKNLVANDDVTDETVEELDRRVEVLERRLEKSERGIIDAASPVLRGKAEGAMSHVTPSHSRFNYGTWDRGAMRHAENLRGIAESTSVPAWSDTLKAAANFLEETVAASEGSYK